MVNRMARILAWILALWSITGCGVRSTAYGPLVECSYSYGGGMLGDSYQEKLYTNEAGEIILRVESNAEMGFPVFIREYRAEADALDNMRKIIDRYNLPAWSKLPLDENAIQMDGPTASISMVFDNNASGGSQQEWYTVSYAYKLPRNGQKTLDEFRSGLTRYIAEEPLEAWCENRDGDIIGVPPGKLGSEEANALNRLLYACYEFTWALDDGIRFHYAGEETIDGTTCYVFALENEAATRYAMGPSYTQLWVRSETDAAWTPYKS